MGSKWHPHMRERERVSAGFRDPQGLQKFFWGVEVVEEGRQNLYKVEGRKIDQ